MPLDSRTPVLVGAGAIVQREDDPTRAAEPLELMARALESAADDAACPELLARLDEIAAPRGFWAYGDPGRLLADRFQFQSALGAVISQLGPIDVLAEYAFGGEKGARIGVGLSL